MVRFAQQSMVIETPGRSTLNVTDRIQAVVADAGVALGLCHVFLPHTSASLMLCENADPDVRHDLETFLSRLVPDGDPRYVHDAEGPDDMPAHIRSVLTHNDLTLPIADGRCALGTWQGVYLWEHRHAAHRRRLVVTVQGEEG